MTATTSSLLDRHNMIGLEVGAGRWPFSGSHPDCWEEPIMGTIIPMNDPRAWLGTLAFGDYVPTQADVDDHIARIYALYETNPVLARKGIKDPFGNKVAVLWAFGKVFFEDTSKVVPYREDYAAWMAARGATRAAERSCVAA